MLSIIIPVFNKINFTLSALNDLFKLNNVEIIIIDNNSSDNTQIELSKINKPNFKYIRNNENLFHSKACNIGFKNSTGDYILFLNNDIRIKSNHENWIDDLIKVSDENFVGIQMGQLDKNLNFIKEKNCELDGNSYISGWFICSSRKNWMKLQDQVFDETIKFYFNDCDLSFRIKQQNLPIKIIDLPITHFGKVSAKQLNISSLYKEGREIFIKKWAGKI